MDIFEKWAKRYDETVWNTGDDNEYKDVFAGYSDMLASVVKRATGQVLEIGAGTGNLTERLIRAGKDVIAIDPSQDMRKIANQKGIPVMAGHFLDIPMKHKFDTIVSTFAFHHLNDVDKQRALSYMKSFLNDAGQIILIDTLFETEDAREQTIQTYKNKGDINLVEDLRTEYYPLKAVLTEMVMKIGGQIQFERLNHFAWQMQVTFASSQS
ncbi:class I SAM-dependent methyltransferase [Staphylococcus lutrae]|nr:class I SAM-dependent methyltransferase [Staphylococcus lutrae]